MRRPSLIILQVTLVDGQKFRFDMDDELGDSARVQLPHREIIDTLGVVRDAGTSHDIACAIQLTAAVSHVTAGGESVP